MFNSNVPSLSDIAAVTNSNNGFGNGDGWWILVILLALFNGWNGNGIGRQGGVQDNYVLASDFSNIERKIDSVNNGLCDGFYAMNSGMLTGFNNTNVALLQGFNGVQAGQTALSTQIAQCCCDNKAALADLKYTMATDTCALNTAINQMGQNIMLNDNANYRQLHDEIVTMKMEAKDATIAELRAELERRERLGLRDYLVADNAAQTNYLLSRIQPPPVPSFNVPNPWSSYGCGMGCNNFA